MEQALTLSDEAYEQATISEEFVVFSWELHD